MKKLLALIIILCTVFALVGCSVSEPIHTRYDLEGRYLTNGTIITSDGEKWNYYSELIGDEIPYDNMPLLLTLDDNGTPEEIKDDIITGVVYDFDTAVTEGLASYEY